MPRTRPLPVSAATRGKPAFPVRLTLRGTLREVRRGAAAVRRACARLGLSADETYRIETAAVEALNNAVLHAAPDVPGARVGLTLALVGAELVIEVSDTGAPIPAPDADPAPPEPGGSAEPAERGRGWGIMRAWMDEVRCLRRRGRNVVQLRKRLKTT